MRKVSMQDIADNLGISRVTVWKALNNRSGVSEETRQKIFENAEEMGFFSSNSHLNNNLLSQKNVAVVVSRPDSSSFWLQIIHELARYLSKENINLLYIYLPSNYSKSYKLPKSLTSGDIDTMLVLNVYSTELLNMLNALPMHKIFLDLTPELDTGKTNGDLLFLEGKDSIYRITKKLLDVGKKKVAFVGDINYARTNLERYRGYQQAFEEKNIPEPKELCLLDKIPIDKYPQTVDKYIEDFASNLPEAFVCANDHLAYLIASYFKSIDYDFSEKIILTGYDNLKEYQAITGDITTVDVDTKTLGQILAQKIMFRLISNNTSREISYISFPIIFRGELDT